MCIGSLASRADTAGYGEFRRFSNSEEGLAASIALLVVAAPGTACRERVCVMFGASTDRLRSGDGQPAEP